MQQLSDHCSNAKGIQFSKCPATLYDSHCARVSKRSVVASCESAGATGTGSLQLVVSLIRPPCTTCHAMIVFNSVCACVCGGGIYDNCSAQAQNQ